MSEIPSESEEVRLFKLRGWLWQNHKGRKAQISCKTGVALYLMQLGPVIGELKKKKVNCKKLVKAGNHTDMSCP